MTDQWGFDSDTDNFEQANQNGNKGLRSWAEKVDKQNKEQAAVIAELQNQLKRQQAVNLFEDLGLSRSAASLYNGDLTPDAVNAWASNVRSAFGIDATPAPTDQPPAAPALDAQTQNQYQNITQAGANSTPSTTMDDMLRAQHQANSVQDLINNAALWQR